MDMQLNERQIMKEFIHLLKIPSPSQHEKDVATYIKHRCKEMDIEVLEDNSKKRTGSNVGNLICSIKGTCPEAEPLFFTAHMDTVETGKVDPRMQGGYVMTDGTTALGADDKVGIIALLEAISYIKDAKLPYGDIELIFTVCEEQGLVGARTFDRSLLQGKMGYTIDADEPIGTLVTKSPAISIGIITIRANMREVIDEVGKNVAKVIQSIHTVSIDPRAALSIIGFKENEKESLYAMDITVQLHAFTGSNARLCMEQLEARVRNVYDKLHVTMDMYIEHICTSYAYTSSDRIVQIASSAVRSIGKEPIHKERNDVSDANVFTSTHTHAMNIGAGYEEIHTDHEKIALSELYALIRLIIAICKQNVHA